MLSLDDPQWSQLTHAYGSAADVPDWLRQLPAHPTSEDHNEPWFSIWSALAHQGDVYDSTYASVPYVIEALAVRPDRADISFFHFPVWVEICRVKRVPTIPVYLEAPYFTALHRLPELVAAASNQKRDPDCVACLMAAIVVAHGQTNMAEVALELKEEWAEEVLEWLQSK
jgi:hypothetical protein